MNSKTWWIFGGVAVIAVAGAFTFSNGEEEMLEVETATVGLETIVQKVNATGRIQPKTQVRISADVSGKIMALHVEEGDWVEDGQLSWCGRIC
jgi:HlyD family secretion protein